MLRALLLLLIGAAIGAAAFHLYYRGLAPAARCGWDHPLADSEKARCRQAATAAGRGYTPEARREMDSLINEVAP